MLNAGFLNGCAFVSVDFQNGPDPLPVADAQLPEDWRAMGFSADDVNAANRYAAETATPNAVRVARACLEAHIPRIFIHWGFRFSDGMDLDPIIRQVMLKHHGTDATQWGGYMGNPQSWPLPAFDITPTDYVIPKTAQDAFPSSSLGFVLSNLDVRNVILVGGHTEACYGKTAASARRLGYHTCCIHDATFNARESTRQKGIDESRFHHVVSTGEFLGSLVRVRERSAALRANRRV